MPPITEEHAMADSDRALVICLEEGILETTGNNFDSEKFLPSLDVMFKVYLNS